MRRAAILGMLLLSGCESDEDKIARIRNEQMIACLLAQSTQRKLDSVSAVFSEKGLMAESQKRRQFDDSTSEFHTMLKPALDAHEAAQSRCDVANREMNRFMSGG